MLDQILAELTRLDAIFGEKYHAIYLYADGSGCLNRDVQGADIEALSWSTPAEALAALQAYEVEAA